MLLDCDSVRKLLYLPVDEVYIIDVSMRVESFRFVLRDIEEAIHPTLWEMHMIGENYTSIRSKGKGNE